MRTEAEAFSFVIAALALFVAVALVGFFLNGWAALIAFVVLAPVVGFRYFRSDPKVVETAVWDRRRDADGRHRILVVANETVAGRSLRAEVVRRAREGDAEVLVVTPALNTRIRHWTSDEDTARGLAQARLDESLAALGADAVDARGSVGDDDPIQAIEDSLRVFGADEIVISTHPHGRSNWLERGVVDRARERFDLPITHVVVDLEREAEVRRTA
ncbi:MAG TPA: universal stress protein [Gaiellaceae bacterium]